MKNDHCIIEAALLFAADPGDILDAVGRRLIESFRKTGLELTPKFTLQHDRAFHIGGLTLALTRAERPLDVTRFADAGRPGHASAGQASLRPWLDGHRGAIVVRVTGPDRLARRDTRLALCYIAVTQVLALRSPDLIYWAASDTIYTLREFTRTGDARPAARPARVRHGSGRRTAQTPPRPDPAVWPGGHGAHVPVPVPACEEQARLAALRRGPVPGRVRRTLSQGAVMGLTAPVGLGLTLQQILSGLKLS